MFLGMICGEEDIINLISDDDDIVPVATVREGKSKIRTPKDDVPQVAAVHKGKGKARAPSVGEVIELSDWMLRVTKAFGWKLSEQNIGPFEVNNVRSNTGIFIGGRCATLSENYI